MSVVFSTSSALLDITKPDMGSLRIAPAVLFHSGSLIATFASMIEVGKTVDGSADKGEGEDAF